MQATNALRIFYILAMVIIGVQAPPSIAMAAGDGCRQGFVWREAFPGDHVCVTPDVRAQASQDDAQASSRINPTNRDYGPDTCRYGYVWREASRTDHVCVTPDVRAQASRDNAAAASRFANAPAAGSSAPAGRSYSTGSYNPAWQAAPGDTSCCPNNMLVCPTPRHFCGSSPAAGRTVGHDRYNPAWQAAPGDTSCCPNNMLVCPTPRHFCR